MDPRMEIVLQYEEHLAKTASTRTTRLKVNSRASQKIGPNYECRAQLAHIASTAIHNRRGRASSRRWPIRRINRDLRRKQKEFLHEPRSMSGLSSSSKTANGGW